MKFSTALALSVAPLSLARRVQNVYPPSRRDAGLKQRDGHLLQADPHHEMLQVNPHDLSGFTAHKTEVIIIWGNPGGHAATTTYNEKVTVTETVTAPPIGHATPPPVHAPATHTVVVGGDAGLVYTPDQLNNIPIGDMIIFEFLAQNHTVTQSGFDTPCDPLAGGMDTGNQPNPDGTVVPPPQVAMQVTTDKPLWFYCKTGNHCESGMVFSINPTAEKSQAKFKEIAMSGAEGAAEGGKEMGEDMGAATPITGGEPPAGTPPVVEEGGAVPGHGVVGADGSCHCMVSCSASSFPVGSSQGLGAWGGMGGSLPMGSLALR